MFVKDLNNKGMAVVMALAVVLIMATAALQLHGNERNNMLNAAAVRDRFTLEQMTVSGIHLAMAVLVKDRTDSETDSLQEDWADEETMTMMLEQIPFDQGVIGVKIVDELSKIQINALIQHPGAAPPSGDARTPPKAGDFNPSQRELWLRLSDKMIAALEILGDEIEDMEETDPLTIINSVKDWLDQDEDLITGLNGAESDYYQELDPPYACKNGPFDHISEVKLVKGVTPEVFNGIGELGGLSNYITVYGAVDTDNQKFDYPGKVNINTAELAVLTALMEDDNEDAASSMIEYRETLDGNQYKYNLTNEKWYENIPGAKMDPSLITISSDTFRIVATAELNGVKATTTAVVKREQESPTSPWQCKVLNWNTE
jgi:general secretion pathway protein K